MIGFVFLYVCVSVWITFYTAGRLGPLPKARAERIGTILGYILLFLIGPPVSAAYALWLLFVRVVWENL